MHQENYEGSFWVYISVGGANHWTEVILEFPIRSAFARPVDCGAWEVFLAK